MSLDPNGKRSHKIQLIVGLGNPGPQYAKTRHNVGFWLITKLAAQSSHPFIPETKFKGHTGLITVANQPCRLLQPATYMNRSGEAIVAMSQFYKIPPEEILVIHDDLDLPPGNVRLKQEGGHGGHNGLRDIITKLGSTQFRRLRIGIGHPGNKEEVLNYVLHRPSASDEQKILEGMAHSLIALPDIVQGYFQKAMNYLHTITQ